MTDEEQKEPAAEPKIKNIDRKPCGCVLTEYEDGSQVFAPCVPHGLMRFAQLVQEAASVMGSVASNLIRESQKAQQQAGMVEAIKKAQADTAAQDAADADDKPGNIMPGPGAV